MRVLIAASGSYGDVFPFVAIGRELKRRGHDVVFFASAYFTSLIESAGLAAVPLGTVEDYETVVRHPDAFHPTRGMRLIFQANLEHLPRAFRAMESRVVPGETVAIGSTLAFATQLLREKHGVPAAFVHLAPSIFRSVHRPPCVGERPLPAWLPPFAIRAVFWIADRFLVDPLFRELNRFRGELGLDPVERVFHHWIHEVQAVIALFPPWFAPPQPDWPKNVHVTGFPLFDGVDPLPPEAEAFLDSGEPPVIFTAGTAAANERAFFEESVAASRLGGLRAILLTKFREQVPADLPAGVRHFDFLPFSRILPRARALVHHGGIGTSSQALAAGIPQLVRPRAFDQFDNAARLEELGCGRTLLPRRYRAEAIVRALEELDSESPRSACAKAKSSLEGYDAVSATCDVLLNELC